MSRGRSQVELMSPLAAGAGPAAVSFVKTSYVVAHRALWNV